MLIIISSLNFLPVTLWDGGSYMNKYTMTTSTRIASHSGAYFLTINMSNPPQWLCHLHLNSSVGSLLFIRAVCDTQINLIMNIEQYNLSEFVEHYSYASPVYYVIRQLCCTSANAKAQSNYTVCINYWPLLLGTLSELPVLPLWPH